MADIANLEKMGKELKCPICWSLLSSAVSIACNHVFCNSCILESMKSVSTCPVCKVPFRRREVRPVPHMDSLVSIFKSMEFETGTNILSTQVAPAEKNSDGSERDDNDGKLDALETSLHEKKIKSKGSSRRKQKQLSDGNATTSISCRPTRPSFPTKKRIHVTPYPVSDTPTRSPKVLKLQNMSSPLKDNDETDKDGQVASDKQSSPSLSPFFWLREEEEQEEDGLENAERLSSQHSLDTPSHHNAPCFSDMKDSDDEMPFNMTPISKATAMEAFDSEVFEWTQRPCSPELCSTPPTKQTKGRRPLDKIQEKDCQECSENGALCNEVSLANLEDETADARKRKSKKRRKNSKAQKKCVKSSLCSTTDVITCESNQEMNISAGEIAPNSSIEDKDSERTSPSRPRMRKTRSVNRLPLSDKGQCTKAPTSFMDDVAMVELSKQFHTIHAEEKDNTEEKAVLVKARMSKTKSSLESARKRMRPTSGHATDKICKEVSAGSVSKAKARSQNSQNMNTKRPVLLGNTGENSIDSHNAQDKKIKNTQIMESNTQGKIKNQSADVSTNKDAIHIPPAFMSSGFSDNQSGVIQTDSSAIKKLKKVGGFSRKDSILRKCDNVSELSCAFCQSASVTEDSGEMVHYVNGKPVAADYTGGANVIRSHKNCMEWAPDVYFEDDKAINLAAELARSRRIKCCCCGIKGAALGCFERNCRKSFHFTCAKLVPECRWDDENFVMLCPLHQSSKLPFDTCEPQKQTKKRITSKGLSEVSARKSGYDSSQMWTWPSGSASKWVFCCSALSDAEKEIVSEFRKLTGVQILKSWSPTVTHVIASTDRTGACKRTLKFLMAILNGKWIVTIDWIKACMEAKKPVDEEKFEIIVDVHGINEGPRLGRLRAINKQPKLFNGIRFYFTGNYTPSYRGYLQDLVIAAGGTVLHRKPILRDQQKLLDESSLTIIIYSIEHSGKSNCSNDPSVFDRRRAEAQDLAEASGSRIASNTWIIDSIAACKLKPLT
ncbi:protein BREAST CANCER SUSCEPTIBILITY 1 homolog [Typha latifolia]|uniref:protein BREAST CANCER SUSCEPTIBILITY 1 homolog n=1 Tax=Typha latifolia TaxID=4733 RepID=UPI003C2FEBEE